MCVSGFTVVHLLTLLEMGLHQCSEIQKIQSKLMAWNHHMEDKREGQSQEEAGTKVGRELVPLMVRSYLTHNPSDVVSMQIVRSNSNGSRNQSRQHANCEI